MKFEDLTKQQKLLVYMYDNELKDLPFDISINGDEVIRHGITSNKQSLSSMLNALMHKGYVFSNGCGNWYLRGEGENAALNAIDDLDDATIPYFYDEDKQPQNFEDANVKTAFDAMAKSFDAMSSAFAAMMEAFKNLGNL